MTGLYRLLLRLYPASFRADYGEEMTAIFGMRLREARGLARLAVWLAVFQEVLMNAPAVQWDILKQDLRYTFRTLTRARGFALTAILVTALGVGANTAAFSVADFVLLRPLPFPEPDRLVQICEGPKKGGGWGCMNELSPANYRDLKQMSSSFDGMGAFNGSSVNLVGGGEPRRLGIATVTPDLLPVLGVRPALGRVFDSGKSADADTVVISHGLWQSQFGSDETILGRKVTLDGHPYAVIGVMPAGFYFPSRQVQLWTPLMLRDDAFTDRTNTYLQAVGRLKQGVAFDKASTELSMLADRLSTMYPADRKSVV